MAELVVLGSGSGFATKDRFCASTALLVESRLYLLDCGEPCAALLFRQGIDPLALRALFVSHTHPDHVGGLASLLLSAWLPARGLSPGARPWSVSRDAPWYRDALRFPPPGAPRPDGRPTIDVLLPPEAVKPIGDYLPSVYLAPGFLPYDLRLQPIRTGPTYDDGLVRVTSAPNTHLSAGKSAPRMKEAHAQLGFESFSFAVDTGDIRIVYSGDVTSPHELAPLLPDADLLILEVAHYDPAGLGPFLRDVPAGRILLTHIHPGLEDRLPGLVAAWRDPRVTIAHDGLRLPLGAEARP